MAFETIAVVPVLIGPLQVLVALLPALLLSLAGIVASLLKPSAMLALVRLLWLRKVPLLVAVAAAWGLTFLLRTYVFHGEGPGARTAGTDWPMFRGGPERRGAGDAAPPPARGGVNWSFSSEVKTFYASPALVGNRIYVTSADKGPMRDSGAVYCIDADSGAVDWKSAPRGYLATFSSPSVKGRYLVVGEGLHVTKNARVVCMDVTQRGRILWTYATRSHVEATPCIYNDRVYVGAGDDGYYCFLLDPGSDGNARLLWHTPPERFPDAETSPAVNDGLVFAGLGMGGNAVVALNADTGEEVWRAATPYPVFGPPTVTGGSVIIGMGNGNFIETAEEVRAREISRMRDEGRSGAEIAAAEKNLGAVGEVWCLKEKTGEVQWKFAVPDTVLGAVAASDGKLYFGSRDGHLYCLSLKGEALGRWNARAPLLTSPAVSAGHVYIVTQAGTLFGLRTDGLEPVWEARIGFEGPFISSPAVGLGHVYVGSQDDGILCLGEPGGERREERWEGFGGGPGRGGNIDGRPLSGKGKLGWRFPETGGAEVDTDLVIAAPPACLNGALYVPVGGARAGLLCLREEKNRPVEKWFAAASNGVALSPAATSNRVFFADGRKGDGRRSLRCVDAAGGDEKWRVPVDAEASGEFVLTDEGLLVADVPDGLTAFTRGGATAWRTRCGEVLGMPCAAGPLAVAAVGGPAGVLVLDGATGRQLWRAPLESAAAAGPVVRKNVICVGTPAGVAALSLADGRRLWETAGGAPGAPLALLKSGLAYTTADGRLVVVDTEKGAVAWEAGDAVPGLSPLATGGFVVFVNKSGLAARPAAGGDEEPWKTIESWLGLPVCSPVMADSRVYVATDRKGLLCLKSK